MKTNELLKEHFEAVEAIVAKEEMEDVILFLKRKYGTCKTHQEGCMSCEVTKTIKLLKKVIKDLDE